MGKILTEYNIDWNKVDQNDEQMEVGGGEDIHDIDGDKSN